MAGPITLPAGAFAAAKSGAPQPTPEAPKEAAPPAPAAAKPEPKKAPAKEGAPKPEAKEEAPPPGLTPAEKKIWKLKADGEEFDFDATDEEAVKREIMKARGADKRFQTAAQLKQQAERFFEMIKNPQTLKQVLADPRIGVDVKKFAEDLVWESIQESKLTPEQKAQRDKDQELQRYKDQEAKGKADAEEKAKQAEVERYEAHYEKTILAALEVGGVPKTPEAAARMGHYLGQALAAGLDLSPAELVEVVRADYTKDLAAVLGEADGDALLSLLGEGVAKKIREADLKRLKSSQGKPFPKRSEAKQASEGRNVEAPKKLGTDQWKAEVAAAIRARK